MLPALLAEACADVLDTAILSAGPVGGGDINEARRLETEGGVFFLKFNRSPQAKAMFEAEARGLEQLEAPQALRIPRVQGAGQAGPFAFLILEFVESGAPSSGFWRDFGRKMALLHQYSAPRFGWVQDNFIGSLPQANPAATEWISFYMAHRLQPQVQWAHDKGLLDRSDLKNFDLLYQHLPDLLVEEKPAMVHGDLWSGNFLADADGQPVLIDPAVYFGHREVDLAMTRLFGGFSPDFYRAYHEAYALSPGWEERLELYQLYYLLVHVNLFGQSYVGSVRRIVSRYT